MLAASNSLGARIGVRFAVTRGQSELRLVVFAAVIAMCLVLLTQGG